MTNHLATLIESPLMRIVNSKWIAIAILSLFTNVALAQGRLDLAAVIASGNTAISESVYGVNTTAYVESGGIHVVGEGPAKNLDIHAYDLNNIDFTSEELNSVNTVVIRFDNVSETSSSLNSAALSALENLSDVVLLFTYDVQATDASSFNLASLPAGVTTYYSISIPE
jgi:hypothetical protein